MLCYVLIALAVIATAVVGGMATKPANMRWYSTIRKPSWTPPGNFIASVWFVLYSLIVVAAITACRVASSHTVFWIMAVLAVNLVLNAAWSWIFFSFHRIKLACLDALLVAVTALILTILALGASPWAALLLAPYVAWTCFATYLNYTVLTLNA